MDNLHMCSVLNQKATSLFIFIDMTTGPTIKELNTSMILKAKLPQQPITITYASAILLLDNFHICMVHDKILIATQPIYILSPTINMSMHIK